MALSDSRPTDTSLPPLLPASAISSTWDPSLFSCRTTLTRRCAPPSPAHAGEGTAAPHSEPSPGDGRRCREAADEGLVRVKTTPAHTGEGTAAPRSAAALGVRRGR